MAQFQYDELCTLCNSSTYSLQLQECSTTPGEPSIWCDVSSDHPWPFLPVELRCAAFDTLHQLSHPGIRGTHRKICLATHESRHRYVDLRMYCLLGLQNPSTDMNTHPADYNSWHCIYPYPYRHCQALAILLRCFLTANSDWQDDMLVKGISYCDNHSWRIRQDICAKLGGVLWSTTEHYISMTLLQVTSALWSHLAMTPRVKIHDTTSYHPQANGVVKRQHC